MGAISGLRLSVLGPIVASLDDQPLPKLPTLRAQGLLIYLAVEAALGTAEQRREALMDLFWPGMPPKSARKSLRTTLYYLRQAIGDQEIPNGRAIPFLFTDRQIAQINPDYPIELDLARFLQLLAGAKERWPEAIDLYRGDFLAGFTIPDANPFEEWAVSRRAAFRQQLLHSLDRLAVHAIKTADFDQAERLARRQLESDNLRESAWRKLMESLARRGRRGEALAEYEACVEVLWKELGVEPSAETQKLHDDILAGTLQAPEADSSKSSTVSGRRSTVGDSLHHNLPAQMTPFIGREGEIAEMQELLETARLVTLTGPGGTGKTRLGLQVAESVAGNYADGLTFVALASTTDPALVPNTIARELGVVERPDQSLVESLKRYFGKKHSLLVLDNFEHVLEAASLVSGLLSAAPQLNVLATSRESLHLTGEHEYPVPPLTVPSLAHIESLTDLSTFESVALFIQRARAVSPSFSLTEDNADAVADICIHLDGLPLAIELAAARIKLFSPQQMLERLESRLSLLTSGSRDLPARQQTLRNTIDWSYNLLDEKEQRLFARLAVFAGGCTLESAAAICSLGHDTDILAGVESLLYKSLLYQEVGPGGEPRFLMLDTIHEYALERLSESGEEIPLRNKHLAHYLALAESFEPEYRRHKQTQFLARTEAELDNLRTAFAWAMDNSDYDRAARLVSAVDYYLTYSDRLVEGYRLFKRVLAHIDDISPERRVRLLQGAARLAIINSDLSQGRHFCRQGLELAKESGDRRTEAWLEVELAILSVHLNQDIEAGINRCQKGLAVLRELDDKPGVAWGLNVLGEILRTAGKYDQALKAYEESLAASHETGEIYRQVLLLTNLSFVAYHDGDYEKAKKLADVHLQKILEISWKKPSDVYSLAMLAGPLGQLGKPEKGARLLGASEALMEEMGADIQPTDVHEIEKYKDDLRAKLDETTFNNAWAEGQAMTTEQAIDYALGE